MPTRPIPPHAQLNLPGLDWVSHGLDRMRVLRSLVDGSIGPTEAQDAPRSLIDSAEVLGFQRNEPCPVCGKPTLYGVYWVYGEQLGERSGTARAAAEITAFIDSGVHLDVHEVEVCTSCRWNHLVRSARL